MADSKQPWLAVRKPKLANKLSLPSRESAAVRNIIITCSKRKEGERGAVENRSCVEQFFSSITSPQPVCNPASLVPFQQEVFENYLCSGYTKKISLKIIRDTFTPVDPSCNYKDSDLFK